MKPVRVGDAVAFNGNFGCISSYLPRCRVLVNMHDGAVFSIPTALAMVLVHDFKMGPKVRTESES